jgi:hypothetical protein
MAGPAEFGLRFGVDNMPVGNGRFQGVLRAYMPVVPDKFTVSSMRQSAAPAPAKGPLDNPAPPG